MKNLYYLLIISLITACTLGNEKASMEQIDKAEQAGNFTEAQKLIDLYIAQNALTEDLVYQLQWRKDRMRRIIIDFDKSKDDVLEVIRKYYPDVTDEQLAQWEHARSLESMVIDGEKRYFDRSANNLFRIDKEAIDRKREVDNPTVTPQSEIYRLPELVAELKRTGKTQSSPVSVNVRYRLTLHADAVPDGEVVRCWLPYPREDHRRQFDVRLHSVNDSVYLIAPQHYPHRSLYMEKVAHKGEPLVFAYEFSYRSVAEWFDLESHGSFPSYSTYNEEYKTYTAERPPHIVFSDSIKAISERVVGSETDPYQKVKKIFRWIDENYPWAGAREYSTIENIPEYVLANGHGDCGQVTLLFITLARYNGIPARWQSGFAVLPATKNLHDWCEYYIEGIGWIPLDQSHGQNSNVDEAGLRFFFAGGIDPYRWIVNNDLSQALYPAKLFPRSDNVDFQRGELEWRGGNIYYNLWDYDFEVDVK
ncbi:MAG: transglutaminase domain-containing protein [Tannerella sp.]|jgi:transglutaminase-like putative cysteine protease|nr:transglutaminase domain-containing protein [Tannerella sp.]